MEMIRVKGLPLLGVTIIGLIGCYYLYRRTFSKSKQVSSNTRRCTVLFSRGSGASCALPGHKASDCRVEECPVRFIKTLKAILNTATSSVDICLYNLTHSDLENTLTALIPKKVKLRCVVGNRGDEERQFVTNLRANGAFVREKAKKPPPGYPFQVSDLLMHHKFVIIDNRILLTGSMNWTNTSFYKHWDHIMVCTDRILLQQFANEFNTLFDESPENERSNIYRPKKDVQFQACFFKRQGLLCRADANKRKNCDKEDCVFPLYKAVLFKLLAVKSLDLCIQQLTLEDLSQQIIFSHENGTNVRVICDKGMAQGTGSQIKRFIDAGIPVRMNMGDSTMHHKFIIVDEKTLVSGSLNWTMQSFFGNYENIIFITHKKTISEFQNEFEKMWNGFTLVDNNNWEAFMKQL